MNSAFLLVGSGPSVNSGWDIETTMYVLYRGMSEVEDTFFSFIALPVNLTSCVSSHSQTSRILTFQCDD